MNRVTYDEESLPDVLPLYYKRLFPHSLFYRWLSYGDNSYMANREISFTLLGDVYVRFLSFNNEQEFRQELMKKHPVKIDIGAIYNVPPKSKRIYTTFVPVEKEMIFDIDLTDYDEVRTCCEAANICDKCWKFMVIACKIVDSALRQDFGFQHILWVYSGRRGVHCWVCDESARKLDEITRDAIAEYLNLIKGGPGHMKRVVLPGEKIHTSVRRALDIVNECFVDFIIKEQNILGDKESFKKFLFLIDDDLRGGFEQALLKVETSAERWEAFVQHFDSLNQKQQIPKNLKNLKEEIVLHYAYPRLDIMVSKGFNHLLKAPFCIHPKTGRICVPFNPKLVDKFNPGNVPTISLLVDEINQYDAKTKQQAEGLEDPLTHNIKDYRKTSLLKSINLFEEFLRGIEKASKSETIEF